MPVNGQTYKLSDEGLSDEAIDQLKEIEGDSNLDWDDCVEEYNNLQICTNYNKEKVSLLKEKLIELAREKCGFVRPYEISSFVVIGNICARQLPPRTWYELHQKGVDVAARLSHLCLLPSLMVTPYFGRKNLSGYLLVAPSLFMSSEFQMATCFAR
jgi:hypothetical protein